MLLPKGLSPDSLEFCCGPAFETQCDGQDRLGMPAVRPGLGKRPLVVAVTRPCSLKKWPAGLTLALLSALDERDGCFLKIGLHTAAFIGF